MNLISLFIGYTVLSTILLALTFAISFVLWGYISTWNEKRRSGEKVIKRNLNRRWKSGRKLRDDIYRMQWYADQEGGDKSDFDDLLLAMEELDVLIYAKLYSTKEEYVSCEELYRKKRRKVVSLED